MYSGTVPANMTKTVSVVTSFDLSTPFDVCVSLANSSLATYTLTPQLTAADATNTWSGYGRYLVWGPSWEVSIPRSGGGNLYDIGSKRRPNIDLRGSFGQPARRSGGHGFSDRQFRSAGGIGAHGAATETSNSAARIAYCSATHLCGTARRLSRLTRP